MYIAAQSRIRRNTWAARFIFVRADAAFHAYVALYAVIGLGIGLSAGVPGKFAPLTYAYYSLPLAFFAIVIGGGIWALWSRQPFATIRRASSMSRQPQAIAASLLFVSLSVHMGIFTSIKTMLTDITPFYADRVLADVDELLHGSAPWHYTTALLPTDLTVVICRVYFGAWGLLLPLCLLACLFAPKLRPVRAQYLWTHLLVWPLLGNIVAGAAMSAGPVFYGLVTGDGARFGGLTRYLSHFQPLSEGTAYLWQTYLSGRASPAGGISAFPSMHLANATLFVLLARQLNRRLIYAGAVFCAVILFCSVHLGWHYAIDGYFSILATLAVWWAVGRVLRRLQQAEPQRSVTTQESGVR
jgi:hypothetical protein